MTDETSPDAGASPNGLAAYTPDEDSREGIVPLGKTGALLVFMDGTRYLLREPRFGQMRTIRVAAQRMQDIVADASDEQAKMLQEVNAFITEVSKLAEADLTAAQKRKRDQLTAKAKDANRKLADVVDDARLEWWQLVFRTLGDAMPPDDAWPAWIVDDALPGLVTVHWRTVPLAPGR